MIVLAIAGLILAVVFIAVPALQRNQRNSARANDRSYIRNAYLQAITDNGGRRPDAGRINLRSDELNWVGTAGDDTVAVAMDATQGPTASHAQVVDGVELIYFVYPATPPAATHGYTFTAGNPNALLMVTGVRCGADLPDITGGTNPQQIDMFAASTHITTNGANRNSIAIFYQNEGNDQIFCQDDTN